MPAFQAKIGIKGFHGRDELRADANFGLVACNRLLSTSRLHSTRIAALTQHAIAQAADLVAYEFVKSAPTFLNGGWNLDPWGSNSLGTTQPIDYYFHGTIGDVAVYPTALSAAQVSAHYAANQGSH